MRLHLLQAIALYHQNKRKESLQLLKTAQQELKVLKVDENSIATLIELGKIQNLTIDLREFTLN